MRAPIPPNRTGALRNQGALALGLLAATTACPADVPLEGDATTGVATTGSSTGPLTGDDVGVTTTASQLPGSSSTGSTTTNPGDTTTTSTTTGTSTTTSTSTTSGDSTSGTTSGTTTSEGSTSSGESTADASSSGGASTADASTTSTGTTSTGTSTGDDSATSGDTSSGESSSSGGEDVVLTPFELCCEPGCSVTLLQSVAGAPILHHSGAKIFTNDGALVVWDADTLAPILRIDKVGKSVLVGNTLAYERAGQVHLVDAGTLTELAACPAATSFGLARDESYLWTAGPLGIEVLEPDCTLRWSVAGPLGAAKVLASPDQLHVYEPDLDPQAVAHFDAADGTFALDGFAGTFTGWFADVPRFWTILGNSYYVYDTDGSQLELRVGTPKHGWGTRLLVDASVRDVFTKQTLYLGAGTYWPSGPAVMVSRPDDMVPPAIVRLDANPPVLTPIVASHGLGNFAYVPAKGVWVVGAPAGLVDHLGRVVAPGAIVEIDGSSSGRVVADVRHLWAYLYDVDGDACSAGGHPRVDRAGTRMVLPNDGSQLVSREYGTHGTRRYALPGFEVLSDSQLPWNLAWIDDYEVSDHSTASAMTYYYSGYEWGISGFPFNAENGGHGTMLPRFAPDALHVVTTDANDLGQNPPNFAFGVGYIHDTQGLVGAFPGVPRGFLDDEHILVGRYSNTNVFVKMEVVGLDGVVTHATTLPEIREMLRVGTGEILGTTYPGANAAIFEPFTSTTLWTAPPGAQAVVAGPDHVVTSDQSRLVLQRWR